MVYRRCVSFSALWVVSFLGLASLPIAAEEHVWVPGPKPCGPNGGAIRVKVKDKTTALPLVGAEVTLIGFGLSPRVRHTSSNGAVDFIGLESGEYKIVISLDGFDKKRRHANVDCGSFVRKNANILP